MPTGIGDERLPCFPRSQRSRHTFLTRTGEGKRRCKMSPMLQASELTCGMPIENTFKLDRVRTPYFSDCLATLEK